jgi:hypothetical protein
MGRPLNKKFFGADGAGFQITGTAWFDGEGAAEAAFIVEQKASRRFLIEGVTSGKTQAMSLGDGTPAQAGDFQVLVNGSESAMKITAHRVSTFAGDSFAWSDITDAADSASDSIDADLGDDTDNN